MNMPLIVQGGGDSRAARPGGPVDARLEGRVALADGGVSIALECIDLHGSNAGVRRAPSFCSVVKSAGVACRHAVNVMQETGHFHLVYLEESSPSR